MAGGRANSGDAASESGYQDENPVGDFVRGDAKRQDFVEHMVRTGQLGDASFAEYVSDPAKINPNAWMQTSPDGRTISVFPSAFSELNYYSFGTVLYHEYVHSARNIGYTKIGFRVSPRTQSQYMKEAEAYTLELSNRNPFRSGLSAQFIRGSQQGNFLYGAGNLTAPNLQRLRNLQFNCATGGGC